MKKIENYPHSSPCFLQEQLYIKGILKNKKTLGGGKSSHINSPWLMNPSQLCSTGRENAPLVLSKDKHFDGHVTSQPPF